MAKPANRFAHRAPAWADLEPHLYDIRAQAYVIETLIEAALRNRHPTVKTSGGAVLMLDDSEIEALRYIANALASSAEAAVRQFEAPVDPPEQPQAN